MTIILFIAILVALIWVHELGHFSVAKLFGVKVNEFAIGFPPRLLTVQWGETRYSFNLLLVGGYVSIEGEDPGKGESDPRSLSRKSRPVQAAVMLAGIVFNVLAAWLLLSAGYMAGFPSTVEHAGYGQVANARPTIVAVLPGSPAEKAGVKYGDVVVGVETAQSEGPTAQTAEEVHQFLTAHAEESIVLHVERWGQPKDFVAKAADGVVDGRKVLGVQLDDIGTLRLPPHVALAQGAVVGWQLLSAQMQALGGLLVQSLQGSADVSQLSGPIGIVAVGSQFVAQGFAGIISITALISLNLALVNILPIPGLDGGRLLFIIIEGILRRPINQRLATNLTIAGFALLITLMLVVSYYDIAKLVG